MARRGAKRKLVKREPNGRPQRLTTLAQIEAADRASRETEMSLVKTQPHRKDAKDPASDLLHSPLGRFITAFGLRHEFYDGGNKYASKKNRIRAFYATPREPGAHQSGSSSGGTTLAQVREWEAEVKKIEDCVARVHDDALKLVQGIVLDGTFMLRIHQQHILTAGLRELAIAVGSYNPREEKRG